MKQEHIPYLLVAVPLLPLLAAILNTVVFALTHRSEKTKVQYWTILISIGATLLALGAHFSVMQLHPPRKDWISNHPYWKLQMASGLVFCACVFGIALLTQRRRPSSSEPPSSSPIPSSKVSPSH